MEEILKNSGIIIGAIIVYLAPKVEQYLKNRSKKKCFVDNISIDCDINRELLYFVNTYKACRACIIDYSNGSSNYAGLPFNHFTMTYEEVSINTPRVKDSLQKIPLSSVASMLLALEKSSDGYIKATDVDDNEKTTITHRSFGIKTTYNFKIGNSLIDGVVAIAWDDNYEDLDPSKIIDIKARIARIMALRNSIKKHD